MYTVTWTNIDGDRHEMECATESEARLLRDKLIESQDVLLTQTNIYDIWCRKIA